jgi:hypothetical protein
MFYQQRHSGAHLEVLGSVGLFAVAVRKHERLVVAGVAHEVHRGLVLLLSLPTKPCGRSGMKEQIEWGNAAYFA